MSKGAIEGKFNIFDAKYTSLSAGQVKDAFLGAATKKYSLVVIHTTYRDPRSLLCTGLMLAAFPARFLFNASRPSIPEVRENRTHAITGVVIVAAHPL